MKNWKTNLAAILVLLIGIGTKLGYLTPEVGSSIVVIGTSLGLFAAQDGKKAE